MLLEDQLEPLARTVADLIVQTEHPPGSAWADYQRSEDLIPLRRWSDTAVGYVRERNPEGRIILEDVKWRELNPENATFHPAIVLRSVQRASDIVEFHNPTSEVQGANITHRIAVGKNELTSILAAFGIKNTTSAEASVKDPTGIAQAKASTTTETELRTEFSRQTGMSEEKEAGGTFPFRIAPYSGGEAVLTWLEEEQQRRVTGFREVDAKIIIGRHHRYRKYNARKARREWKEGWTSGSPYVWDSVEHLVAVFEQRGSVDHKLYHQRAREPIPRDHIKRIQAARSQNVDFLAPPFRGANRFRVAFESVYSIDHTAK